MFKEHITLVYAKQTFGHATLLPWGSRLCERATFNDNIVLVKTKRTVCHTGYIKIHPQITIPSQYKCWYNTLIYTPQKPIHWDNIPNYTFRLRGHPYSQEGVCGGGAAAIPTKAHHPLRIPVCTCIHTYKPEAVVLCRIRGHTKIKRPSCKIAFKQAFELACKINWA